MDLPLALTHDQSFSNRYLLHRVRTTEVKGHPVGNFSSLWNTQRKTVTSQPLTATTHVSHPALKSLVFQTCLSVRDLGLVIDANFDDSQHQQCDQVLLLPPQVTRKTSALSDSRYSKCHWGVSHHIQTGLL